MDEPRSLEERTTDTLNRLANDVDAWVATADGEHPYLMPLSFLWDGTTVLLSTADSNPTARYLRASGKVRLGVGDTRDVVLIEANLAEVIPASEIPERTGNAFAEATGFDPREIKAAYSYYRVVPQHIQAWREVNELVDRNIMVDGEWLIPD